MPDANTPFKLESALHEGQFLQVENGEVTLGPDAGQAHLWKWYPDTAAIQNIETGHYLEAHEEKGGVTSSTPTAWKVHDNNDGTWSFQEVNKGIFASVAGQKHAPSLFASSKASSGPDLTGQAWKIIFN